MIVAADPEARREAMVDDWWQSFGQGEDALMVAKRNAEVEKLNALARERMRAEGRLGEAEIEVGEARFAAGDQVITRVNDHKRRSTTASAGGSSPSTWSPGRWCWTESTPVGGCVSIPSIWGGLSYGDPALQHAYAATTYQAQGATVDRAYVMADPSMDRQEFYVAASRTREETYFYATPEVQFDREEVAPRSSHSRQGLEHIAEAAERDGSQSAAHDEALRSSLGQLSTEELTRRRQELRAEAGAERHNEESHKRLTEQVARTDRNLDRISGQAEGVGELPRRQRRPELERLQAQADRSSEAADRLEAQQRRLGPVEHRARAEAAVIDYLLAERQRAELAALRISPPAYVIKELGERPSDLRKRSTWDRAAQGIEGYRKENGVRDRDNALGARPDRGPKRAQWEAQQRRLREGQRRLGREQARSREALRGAQRSLGIGR